MTSRTGESKRFIEVGHYLSQTLSSGIDVSRGRSILRRESPLYLLILSEEEMGKGNEANQNSGTFPRSGFTDTITIVVIKKD